MINDREQQIFEAFAKLALRKHENKELPQITIAEIAKEAGISKQAMTKYHFKTLEELVDTMHRRMSLDIHSTFANFSPEQKICPITVMAEYVLPALYPWMNLIKAAYVAPTQMLHGWSTSKNKIVSGFFLMFLRFLKL
ncbi:hypothetical protein GHI93_07925 [Lactococcus hircilactis]|uniref:TetR/AcrR family transcriptional regulator n=1 Tax=Lactococcus hircilactis TaxID=1494462 RepID=A0A7X1Z8L9_9LACT|nr:TetR/AcrR family transcriptional regulator [Lactococcus hircilactis]MQW39851.1 hypothetical protein [Lactococcus hircilactis]